MNRRSLLTTAVSGTAIGLAGCATNGGSMAEFNSTIESFSTTVPVYAEYVVEVRVENVGDERGSYPVKFAIDNAARSRSVTLDPGESNVVTFTHTFEEPGVRTVAVDDEKKEVAVIKYTEVFDDPILESAHTAMRDLSTLTETQTREFLVYPDVIAPRDEEATDSRSQLTLTETSTTDYDFETDRFHASMKRTLTGSTRRLDKWFAEGRVYTREQPAEGGPVETSVEESTFSEARRTNPPRILVGANPDSRRETETEYIYTVDHTDYVALRNFIDATVPESDLIAEYIDSLETFEAEIHIEKDTQYLTAVTVTAELIDEDTDKMMGTIDLSLEYSSYDGAVDVSVPRSVTAAVGARPQ